MLKKCHFRGIDALKKSYDLPTILKKDRKKVLPPPGKGISLIESIMTCLWEDCDICLGYNKMLHFLATEICSNPEYTKYMNLLLSQEDVNYNLLALNKKTEYSRLVAELYIPAISNALDLHIRVIQNIGGYYGVLNTCPLPNMGSPENKKTITLILIDDTYHPVVNVPGQPPTVYKSIQQVSTEKCPVILMGETPEKKQTTPLFVPETQVIPET